MGSTGVTKVELLARGFSAGAHMLHGQVRQSWLDIVLHVASDTTGTLGASLRDRVHALCPEHAHKINDWRNLGLLAGPRVRAECWGLVEAFMEEKNLTVPPVPSSWVREPWMLQQGRQATAYALSPEEQLYVSSDSWGRWSALRRRKI